MGLEPFASCLLLLAPAVASAAPTEPPPIEAVRRLSPLELRLVLARKEIPRGGSLHFRLTLKNIGERPVRVWDNVVKDPKLFAHNRASRMNAYIVIIGPAGTDIDSSWEGMSPMICGHDPISVPPRPKERVKSSDEELDEFIDSLRRDPNHSKRDLAPGESVSTPPWAAPRWVDCKKTPQPAADQYTELVNVEFSEIGKYKVRAVYDTITPEKFKKKYKKLFDKWEQESKGFKRDLFSSEIKLETPWLSFEVK